MGDRLDVGDARSRPRDEDLLCLGEDLVYGDLALLGGDAHVCCEGEHALSRDTGKDGVSQLGRDEGAVLQVEEDVTGGAFLHVALLAGIEEDRLHVALFVRFLLDERGDHVVRGALDPSGTLGGGAYPVGGDGLVVRSLEVGAHRCGDDDHPGVVREVEPDSRLGVGEGSYVDRVAREETVFLPLGVVAGIESQLLVPTHHLLHREDEELLGEAGHLEAFHGAAHASGVLVGSEELERAVLLGKGLEPLEDREPVLGAVVDEREVGEGVAPREEGHPRLVREGRLGLGGEVDLRLECFLPRAVGLVLGLVHPRVEGEAEALCHGFHAP